MKSLPLVLGLSILSVLPATPATELVREALLKQPGPCLGQVEWEETRARAERSLARLEEEGKISPIQRGGPVLFDWPMQAGPSFSNLDYYVITDFIDHDPAFPDRLLDYECGDRTYDTVGGVNHNGIDHVLWPFSWYMMDHNEVEVVAAAGGTIFDKEDGFFDRNCLGGGSSNKIAVRHADGSMAWYLHMKTNSLTAKGIGDDVVAGEFLGLVGSSGNSSVPHLHIDFRDVNFINFDPYAGPCNPGAAGSRWIDQRPYFDSEIVALLTHSAPPVIPECPQQETQNLAVEFDPGETVYIGIYHRDLLAGQPVEYSVRRPDDSIAQTDSYSIVQPHYPAASAHPEFILPGSATPGSWKVVVDYQGRSYEKPFLVRGGGGSASGTTGASLRVGKAAGAELRLSWNASCIAGDTDYEVYAGDLGSFGSHAALYCDTAGALAKAFVPQIGDRYYLIVPTNGSEEGFYGAASNGAERAQGIGACRPHVTATCP